MGLDMYLNAKHYLLENIDLPQVPRPIKMIVCEAIYWRKANAIHAWFVKNIQDGVDECLVYEVSHEQLKELQDCCKEVLANHEKAPELLPTQSGFFFGSTGYDEWYFEDLEYTIKAIDQTFKDFPESDWWSFEYQSSW